jgi:hypothetical protein
MYQIKKKAEFVNDKKKELGVMKPISFPKHHLPRHIDLRQWMSLVDHQGDMNTW